MNERVIYEITVLMYIRKSVSVMGMRSEWETKMNMA